MELFTNTITPNNDIDLSLLDDNNINIHVELPGKKFNIYDNPDCLNWSFIPIYKKDSRGKQRYWQIGFDGDNNQLLKISGIVDAKQPDDSIKLDIIPKGNKSMIEQALLQARRSYIDKTREGYSPIYETNTNLNLQLANEYIKPIDDDGNIKKSNCKLFPVLVSPKLDGIRSSIYNNNNNIIMKTRENVELKYLEHIKEEIKVFLHYLPTGTIIDSELYRHGWLLNEIQSVVLTKLTKLDTNIEIKAYILDIIEPNRLYTEDRYKLLLTSYKKYIEDGNINKYFEIVNQQCAYNHQDIIDIQSLYIYHYKLEGLMIRQIKGLNTIDKHNKLCLYTGARNNNLLKFKNWITDEAIIVSVHSANGREKGLALFEVLYMNNKFTVRPSDNFEKRKYWLSHPEEVIGHKYTIKYFSIHPKTGLPKFPIGVSLRIGF